MRNKCLLISTTIFFSFSLNYITAQKATNDESVYKNIKVYCNALYMTNTFQRFSILDIEETGIKHWDVGIYSFALERSLNSFFSREIEIMPINIFTTTFRDIKNEETDISRFVTYESYFRYQFTYNIKAKNLRYYIGASPVLFFNLMHRKPIEDDPYTMMNLGLGISIIPGISARLTENIRLNIDAPFRLYDLMLRRHITRPLNDKRFPIRSTGIENVLFPHRYMLRMGLSFNLNE